MWICGVGAWACLCPAGPAACPLFLPQAAGSRPVLYQAVAQHNYCAQGPEDLDLRQGDMVDVLCAGQWAAGPRASMSV